MCRAVVSNTRTLRQYICPSSLWQSRGMSRERPYHGHGMGRRVQVGTQLDRAHTRLNDRKGIEAMGLNLRQVMDLAICTMSAMTFSWGFVHCDPHPGNILVRRHPTKKGKPQIVSACHNSLTLRSSSITDCTSPYPRNSEKTIATCGDPSLSSMSRPLTG